MKRQKTVVFVGGAHGVGKTFLCRQLANKHSWMVSKQRHVLIEIGATLGLSWKKVALKHDEFIEKVGETITARLRGCSSPVLLVDCHYAIRAEKALRLNRRRVDEEYIHDLDLRLITILKQWFEIRFVLVTVESLIAMARFKSRPVESLDYDHTLEGHLKQSRAEEEFLSRILAHFQAPLENVLFVDNGRGAIDALCRIEEFCLDG